MQHQLVDCSQFARPMIAAGLSAPAGSIWPVNRGGAARPCADAPLAPEWSRRLIADRDRSCCLPRFGFRQRPLHVVLRAVKVAAWITVLAGIQVLMATTNFRREDDSSPPWYASSSGTIVLKDDLHLPLKTGGFNQ